MLDQASDREVERLPVDVLNKLRARFRAVEGEDPMKAEEVTDDQLSVVYSVAQARIAPYADFGVWRPVGQRAAKSMKFVSHFLDSSGSWRTKEIPGPLWFRGRRVGESSARLPSCAILQPLQSWTATLPLSVQGWSASKTVGHCVLLRTRDAGVSTGKQNIAGSPLPWFEPRIVSLRARAPMEQRHP